MATIARGARAVGRGVREVLLTLAAIGGVICIVLVILAFTGGYSLIMFKTGSMTPTIPAGSVALVQRIPASDIAVGDVVTVDRGAALPITHRVTDVEPTDADGSRLITMRGDANDVEDPAPYTVTEVRVVRGSVPALANVIVWFGSPWVLGGITLGASLLVVWAFWPRRERAVSRDSSDTGDESEAAGALVAAGERRRDRRP
jgi:signal peptidase